MNEEELQRIEDAIGLALPNAFREIMTRFPQALIDDATLSDGEGNEFIGDMMISPNVEAILAGITHYRSEPGWPKNYIVVGENGCGEIYSIDVSQEQCPVYVSSPHNEAGANSPHEEGYFNELSKDLKGWVKGLVQRANDRAAGINPIVQTQCLLDELKKNAQR